MRSIVPVSIGLLALVFVSSVSAQVSYEKVEIRTGYGKAREGDKGRLAFDAKGIRFIDESWNEYVAIPASSVTGLSYATVEGARPGSPLSRPFELLGGKKHFLTIAFEADGLPSGVEFKLHKSNYEGILTNAELVTGQTVERPQPEPRITETEPVAPEAPKDGTLRITSNPELAEVEINDAFNGMTPRGKSVKPGEYTVTVSKKGYVTWERKVLVDPGATLEVHAELEEEPASVALAK